ncbi:MAG: hypothetical protein AAGG02_00700 [Cyanobacteria bacterium P01_H01_bin.15]
MRSQTIAVLLCLGLSPIANAEPVDIAPEIIEQSPTLQRWQQEIPDIQQEIRRDPSFRTRVRVGYVEYLDDRDGGIGVGVEDVFVGRTGLTLSADYQTAFNGTREGLGVSAQYYVLPLGAVVNFAPVVGFRYVEQDNFNVSGLDLGLRGRLALSRSGAADFTITQRFVAPGTAEEVGILTLSSGYALTKSLRLSAEWERQNAIAIKETRIGFLLELIP